MLHIGSLMRTGSRAVTYWRPVSLHPVETQDAWVGEPITVDAIYDLPDDGCRHELIGGVHYVSPTPAGRHQRFVVELLVALRSACPADYEVTLPRNLREGQRSHVEPDLLVLRRRDVDDRVWIDPAEDRPVLVVEVVSPGPTNARKDRVDKRRHYQSLGIPSYWLGDPTGVSLTALELAGGGYVERASTTDGERFRVERPFPVELYPTDLVWPR